MVRPLVWNLLWCLCALLLAASLTLNQNPSWFEIQVPPTEVNFESRHLVRFKPDFPNFLIPRQDLKPHKRTPIRNPETWVWIGDQRINFDPKRLPSKEPTFDFADHGQILVTTPNAVRTNEISVTFAPTLPYSVIVCLFGILLLLSIKATPRFPFWGIWLLIPILLFSIGSSISSHYKTDFENLRSQPPYDFEIFPGGYGSHLIRNGDQFTGINKEGVDEVNYSTYFSTNTLSKPNLYYGIAGDRMVTPVIVSILRRLGLGTPFFTALLMYRFLQWFLVGLLTFLILGELGCSREVQVLGALTTVANPIFPYYLALTKGQLLTAVLFLVAVYFRTSKRFLQVPVQQQFIFWLALFFLAINSTPAWMFIVFFLGFHALIMETKLSVWSKWVFLPAFILVKFLVPLQDFLLNQKRQSSRGKLGEPLSNTVDWISKLVSGESVESAKFMHFVGWDFFEFFPTMVPLNTFMLSPILVLGVLACLFLHSIVRKWAILSLVFIYVAQTSVYFSHQWKIVYGYNALIAFFVLTLAFFLGVQTCLESDHRGKRALALGSTFMLLFGLASYGWDRNRQGFDYAFFGIGYYGDDHTYVRYHGESQVSE